MSLIVIAILAAILLFVACAAMLTWAWHGKRVDDHPLCRKCGFDLTGKPESSTRCPECGVDLTRPGSVRIGHRRRRTAWLAAAGTVLLALVLVAGVVGYAVLRQVDLAPYKPIGWIGDGLLSPATGDRVAALRELQRRQALPSPDRRGLLAVADRVLAAQADPIKSWGPEEGDFIDGLRASRMLDDARYARYAAGGLGIVVTPRPKVRIGDVLPVRFAGAARLGSRTPLSLTYRPRLEAGGKTILSSGNSIGGWPNPGNGSMTTSIGGAKDQVARLVPGPIDAEVVVDIEARVAPSLYTSPPATAPVIARKVLRLPQVIDFLPSGTSDDVTPVRAEGLQAKVRSAIAPPTFQSPSAPGYFNGTMKFDAVPEDVAFAVFAVYKGKEFPFGTMTVRKGGSTWYGFGGTAYIGYDIPTEIDVILRPSPAAARATVDQFAYADVEVRFSHIPAPKPATQPANP